MINESELMQGRPIMSDIEADELIEQLKKINDVRERITSIADQKIKEIANKLERQLDTLKNQEEFIKSQLRAYTLGLNMKETKTQKTYQLLSGKIVIKKPIVKLQHDDTKILSWARENGREYIKTVEKLDWTALKNNLDIKGDSIVNKTTGEVLQVEGLSIEQTSEELEVKW